MMSGSVSSSFEVLFRFAGAGVGGHGRTAARSSIKVFLGCAAFAFAFFATLQARNRAPGK